MDILYPRCCVLCYERIAGDGLHFCAGCERRLNVLMSEPACPRCGHSIGPYGLQNGSCRACRARRPRVDRLVRVGPYRAMLTSLVRAFKYGGRDELDHLLGERLADAIESTAWSDSVDALVCVPTHWSHSIGRRYYAPKVLTRTTSRLTGIPTAPVLRRVAGGPHQLQVPRSQRRINVRGKFDLVPGARVAGARLCLVDDVSTIGATLNECARVLKAAGATAVYGAVIAKVDTAHRGHLAKV